MSLREIVGYLLALIAVLSAVGGVWAARHYSPGRRYRRMRARERAEARRTLRVRQAGASAPKD